MWGVTAGKESHNASNARDVTVGKMGRNSSSYNNCSKLSVPRVVCHPMTCLCLPVDEGLISIYLPRAYVTLLQHPLLKQHREGSCLQGILFQICYENKVRRVNNILIIGHPRDTDIRQSCI